MRGVPSLKISLVSAVILHIVVLSFLMVELNFKPTQLPPPTVRLTHLPKKIIDAVSVDQSAVEQEMAKIQQQQLQQKTAEQQRIAKMKRQAREAQKQQRLAQQHLAKIKHQQALALKKQQQKLAQLKKQQAAADKKIAQQKKQQQEQQRLAKLQKQRQAAEKKRLAELKKKKQQQAEAERMLQQQLQEDQKALNSAKQQQIQQEVARYTALIRQSISENWNVPQGSKKDIACILLIRLSPSGNVLNVSLAKSSGDPVLDRSAEAAVYKASPLPVPSNTEVMALFKEIRLTVRPEMSTVA